MKNNQYSQRKFVISGIALSIVVVYLLRLLTLQLLSDDYVKNADSNAFRKEIIFPSRGIIVDRNGKLLVYNEPSYNIMVTMQEQHGVDTLEFCRTVGITRDYYIKRMAQIKDRRKNPGYSRYTPQVFMTQIPPQEYSVYQEKLFLFKGFSVEKHSDRHYSTHFGAHILGDVGEVNQRNIDADDYYRPGDYIGKLGVERSYEQQLRGEKGLKIWLRDVHGRIKGHYKNGQYDQRPIPGKTVTLSIDIQLQALAERLLENKIGSIVAIEPQTGQILCMASSPTYDPSIMVGRQRSAAHRALSRNARKPLLNRSIMGMYPPGSTFKITQALVGLQEGIVDPLHTAFPCNHGFSYKGLHVGCHSHGAPITLVPAIATSCNSYFCWNLYKMFSDRSKYPSVQDAMTRWKDHMVNMGFGYKLGIDLPGERRGMIPNAQYYDKAYRKHWNGLTVISISIGQGEVTATPLQIANLAAQVANRGYYYIPHVVRSIQDSRIDTLYTRRHYTGIDTHWYDYIVEGMRRAVTGGTCRRANLPDYTVCGKTGTAQNRGRDHSAFMGFAPMEHPKIAVSVYVENGGFGAVFGVPIGALIIEQYLNGSLPPEYEAQAQAIQHRVINYGDHER